MEDVKTVTISTRINVTMRVDVRLGADGAEVVGVQDVWLPSANEVMEALDAGGQFDELDALLMTPNDPNSGAARGPIAGGPLE